MSDVVDQYAPTLPRAVRKQVERANEMQAGEAQPTTTTVVDPPVAPVTVNLPAPAAPPAEDWEARYRTLQGKYDREMAHMQQQVTSLQHILAAQAAAAQRPPEPAPAPAQPPAPNLDADRAEYGELVDRAQQWARAAYEPVMEQLRQEIAQLKGATTNQAQLTARQRVEMALTDWSARSGVDWRIQNDDPRFLQWLAVFDNFSGAQRQQMLHQAVQAGDAVRVVNFFDAFAAEMAAQNGQQPSQGTAPAPAPAAPAQLSLETLAAPGRGAAGGAQLPQDKRIWTSTEVTRFYDDMRRGKYRGREAQAQAIERDIFAAPGEGRYQQR